MEDDIDYSEAESGWFDFLDEPITYGVVIGWTIGVGIVILFFGLF